MDINDLNKIAKRMPAEWEAQECVMVAYPDAASDWGSILQEARIQFNRLISELAWHGERVVVVASDAEETREALHDWYRNELGDMRTLANIRVVEVPINDTWTRDYGPLSVLDMATDSPLALDFGFNAWGSKYPYDKDNLVNHNLMEQGVIPVSRYVDCRKFILEGGSVETDGNGTLLTTSQCLLNKNRNPQSSKEEIEQTLSDSLGFSRFLWLDHGHIDGDDTDSHIDTLCRFAPDDIIFYTSAGEDKDAQQESLTLMLEQLRTFRTSEGKPYHLVELPLPDPLHGDGGERLGATYANFLVTPKCVYVPSYGQPQKDRLAAMTVQMVYHQRKIVSVDCRTLIKQGGSLHCSTMQIYPGIFNLDKLFAI